MTAHHDLAAPLIRRGRGPMTLFGAAITPVDGGSRGTMTSGPWMTGPDGSPNSAALGVLIDDTLGRATSAHRPDGLWPVTTELSVDYTAPPPCNGQTIRSECSVVSAQPTGVLVSGTVRDDADRTLALATLRSRFTTTVPRDLQELFAPDATTAPTTAALPEPRRESEPPYRESLLAMLDASLEVDGDTASLRVPGREILTNASGVMHGGIALCATQLAASHWLRPEDGMSLASVRISYLRALEITGETRFVARVVHGGRSFRLIEVVSHGPSGKPGTVAMVAGYSGPTSASV
ncbi:MAG TPA: acyl-CoA thioesterase domain-containing protein [Yinghuangia sp.]|nr:acyl-CoA thioesterase domain-containing protein [Yinghuangia sp.]